MISSALRAVLALLLLMTLLPAVSMVRTAAAEQMAATSTTNVNAGANSNEGTDTNAAASAETEAQTKELGTAVGGFWQLAWEKSWPFIKGVILKSWTGIAKIWYSFTAVIAEIGGSVEVETNANVSGVNLVNVNGSVEVQ